MIWCVLFWTGFRGRQLSYHLQAWSAACARSSRSKMSATLRLQCFFPLVNKPAHGTFPFRRACWELYRSNTMIFWGGTRPQNMLMFDLWNVAYCIAFVPGRSIMHMWPSLGQVCLLSKGNHRWNSGDKSRLILFWWDIVIVKGSPPHVPASYYLYSKTNLMVHPSKTKSTIYSGNAGKLISLINHSQALLLHWPQQ